jgi:hypothetical protein
VPADDGLSADILVKDIAANGAKRRHSSQQTNGELIEENTCAIITPKIKVR